MTFDDLRMAYKWLTNDLQMTYKWLTNDLHSKWLPDDFCRLLMAFDDLQMTYKWLTNNLRMTYERGKENVILTFSACFDIPIFFSNLNSNCSSLLVLRNLQEQVKKSILLPKIVLTFHCLNKLFYWSQKFCKFSALFTRTIFSHSRSEQFW